MCLAALIVFSNSFAADENTPDGFSAPTWYQFREKAFSIEGKGSFDNPIVVKTPGELAQIAWIVNEQRISLNGMIIVLADDIDLGMVFEGKQVTWIPIGRTEERRFEGVFIGVNPQEEGWEKRSPHKISNLYLSANKSGYADSFGLFGYNFGFIGYLAMDNVTINVTGKNANAAVGSLCGTLSAFDSRIIAKDSGNTIRLSTSIYSVSVTDAKLTVSSTSEAGGIVGAANAVGVARASFEGDITTTSVTNVGGITGLLNSNVRLSDCASKVNIKGDSNVGGVMGKSASLSEISFCVSTGNLTGGTNVGGICGQQLSNAKFYSCSSSATVSGSAKVGGITGWCGESETESGGTNTKIDRCVFTGHVRPTGSSYFAGGICGALQWYDNEHISQCLFAGRIDDPANKKKDNCFGLILGKNSKPDNTVGGCYIDQSIAGTGKMSGTVDTLVSVKFMHTQELITGDPNKTTYFWKDYYDGRDFQYHAGFYPRPIGPTNWNGEFSASGCSEACKKLFNSSNMLKENCVSLAQSWLCSVPIVLSKGDCAPDFVSAAEVKRTSTTIGLTNKPDVKLRSNSMLPKSTCVEVKGDGIVAREKGQYTVTLTSTEDLQACFDIPQPLQAVKELQLDITLTPWDGKVATACAAGTGTVDDPFIIKTGAQLAYAIRHNKEYEYYEQLCDITLNEDLHSTMFYTGEFKEWISDGESAPSWKANYDGAGHFVSGAYMAKTGCGFFGTIEAMGSVANLGIIDARGPFKGGLFAGVMNGTITNCIAQGEVSGIENNYSENYQAGGICAIVGNGIDYSNALVEDCITAVSNGYFSYADYTPFVRLSNDNKGTVRNCLCVVPMTHLDKDYNNSGITASNKAYIKDCYWLKGYEEMPTGHNLEQITERLGQRERWQTTAGYFPTLKTFAGTDVAKLLMVPFRSDVDYSYDADKKESDNYLFALGRQVLFEPGVAVWTNTGTDQHYIEVDTDMGVIVPMHESYDPKNKWDDFNRRMPGIVYISAKLGKAQHHIPVRARRNNVNAGFSFVDDNAREACLAAFDTDHNNVLSLGELRAVTNAQTLTAFQTETAHQIKKFPEFRFFKNVTELSSQFKGLSNLESLQLPYALQTINAESFDGCTSLKQVTISSKVTTVKPGAFYKSSVENILVDPFNTKFISREGILFTQDNSLVAYPNGRNSDEAVVPGTVSDIVPGAFYKVPKLKKLFFDTTDYTTVPELAEGSLMTDDGSLMDVYVSDATEGHLLLNGYKKEPSWAPYFNAKKVHQYFPLKITDDVEFLHPEGYKDYLGTFYIGFATQLPEELRPYIVNSVKEKDHKAYYHEKNRLIPPAQPVMVFAEKPGTYRLMPIEEEVARWPVYGNRLIGVNREGMRVNQGDSEQGSILTLQHPTDKKIGFYHEKKKTIEPYHCYLTFNTVDMNPELAKQTYYELVDAEGNSIYKTKGDYQYKVVTLAPDSVKYAVLTRYEGNGGYIKVPCKYDEETPVTGIDKAVFSHTHGTINSIDMTEMSNLEAFYSDRDDWEKPLGGLQNQTIVYTNVGQTTHTTNVVVGDECSDLRLYEGVDFYAPYDFHAAKVSYDRVLRATQNADGSWTSKAYTICLPYDIYFDPDEEGNDNVTFYKLVAVTNKYEFVFRNNFNFYSAGEPAVVVVNKGEYHLNVEDADVIAEPYGDEYDVVYDNYEDAVKGEGTQAGWWRGTYHRISNDEASEMHAFGMSNDGNWRILRNDQEKYRVSFIPPFRAFYEPLVHTNNHLHWPKYIYVENGEDYNLEMQNFPAGSFDGDIPAYDEDPTAIRPVIHTIDRDGTNRYFDMQGRLLNGQPTKGLYIHQGKKVIK